MTVLIVEDTPVSARVFEAYLVKAGYETLVARSAEQALEILAAHPEVQLVLTDLMMPEMDGFELIRRMKAQPEWQDLPVIVATTLADAPNVKQAGALGIKRYLLKPIQQAQLVRQVREILDHQDVVLGPRAEVIARLGLDASVYDEIAATFEATLDDSIHALEERLAGGDASLPLPDIRSLVESATMIGADRVRSVASQLLEPEATSEDAPARDGQLRRLARELRAIKSALAAAGGAAGPATGSDGAVSGSEAPAGLAASPGSAASPAPANPAAPAATPPAEDATSGQ